MQAVTVLTYHEVSDEPHEGLPPGLVTSTARFRRECEWLNEHFRIVPIEDAIARLRSGRLDSHLVVISFDDGYRGVLERAYPVLAAMKAPATLFLNSACFAGEQIGLRVKLEVLLKKYSWDALARAIPGPANRVQFVALARRTIGAEVMRTIDELFTRVATTFTDPYLHAADLAAMSPALITVGNHTRSHRWLAGLSREAQLAEIQEGQRALASLPHFRPYFAVPFGTPDSFDATTLEIVANECGGVLITSYGGLNTARDGAAVHNVLRNSVSENKPPLLQLLWSNYIRSLVPGS
jgi:peptidoglycan/xylan/chitin deacetylase (PgdA/CDA1 family)